MTGDPCYFSFAGGKLTEKPRALSGVFKVATRSRGRNEACPLSSLPPTFKQVSRHPEGRAREEPLPPLLAESCEADGECWGWEEGGQPTGNYGVPGMFDLWVERLHEKLSFLLSRLLWWRRPCDTVTAAHWVKNPLIA